MHSSLKPRADSFLMYIPDAAATPARTVPAGATLQRAKAWRNAQIYALSAVVRAWTVQGASKISQRLVWLVWKR